MWGGWNSYRRMCSSFLNLTVKTALKSVNIWQSYRQTKLAPFYGSRCNYRCIVHPCTQAVPRVLGTHHLCSRPVNVARVDGRSKDALYTLDHGCLEHTTHVHGPWIYSRPVNMAHAYGPHLQPMIMGSVYWAKHCDPQKAFNLKSAKSDPPAKGVVLC